jgi:hypothetical protein
VIGVVGFTPIPDDSAQPSLKPRHDRSELVVSALRKVGSFIADHLEQNTIDAADTIAQLVALLDTQELADAMSRLERGYGLRVVK